MTESRVQSRKWSCEYCTYENWPVAKRCTLCRAIRRPQYITQDEPNKQQNIYTMAPAISPTCQEANVANSGSISPTTQLLRTETSNKWACQICTYLNWPRSQKCTQCLSSRPKVVPVISSQDHTKPLSINVNIEGAGIGYGTQNPPRSSPHTSPNSPEAAKAINNDKNKAVASALRTGKWICKACTFENWPRSIKCTVCAVARGKTFQDSPQGSRSSSNENLAAASSEVLRRIRRRRSPPNTLHSNETARDTCNQDGAMAASTSNMYSESRQEVISIADDRKFKQFRNKLKDLDWLWLNACNGVIEGDSHAVEAFVAAGGDPTRQLNQEECLFFNRPSAFQPGHTLVHLAIRFQREDMLAVLLTSADVVAKAKKRMPSHISPDIATDILRGISSSLRMRKGDFPCYFITELATFCLPADIEDLPRPIQKQLFDELLDRDVQKELEVHEPIVNWSLEITERLGSRMFALWNRTSGDCLLDSALQASWGIFDRDNTLRRALADSLLEGTDTFYPRWKQTEEMHMQSLQFSLEESQWQQDWAILLSLASQPGSALEQIHVFALAHILRRPIIVYGIKYIKSFRGENIGLARFQGVYLPMLWESSFCWKTPIALGYTRGHFSALIPMEIDTDDNMGAGANIDNNEDVQMVYLPLTDSEGKLLPIHFLTASENGREESLLKEWLDCFVTDSGLLVAKMKITKRPLLVRQMLDEWIDRYRRMSQLMQSSQKDEGSHNISSEGETDDE